jgi:Coenzyme PQQ synthesis protein D (PqqD)
MAHTFAKSSGLVSTPMNPDLLIYNPESRQIHVLNKTARQIWEWLDDDITPAQMASRLESQYEGLSRDQALQDINELLQLYVEARLLRTGFESSVRPE